MVGIFEQQSSSKMANTFPAAIANEPPPLDGSSEDEDSEEFQSHGLRLDVPSGDPTPVSTPQKKPSKKKIQEEKRSETESPQPELVLTGSLNDSEIGSGNDSSYENACERASFEDTPEKVLDDGQKSEKVEVSPTTPELESPKENGCEAEINHCDKDSEEIPSTFSQTEPQPTTEPRPASEVEPEDITSDQQESPVSDLPSDKVDEETGESSEGHQEVETNTNQVVDGENDTDFDEFQAFEGADPVVNESFSVNESGNVETVKSAVNDDDFDDDDFGAFQSIPQPTTSQPCVEPVIAKDDDDDDDDFGDFAQNSAPVPTTSNDPKPTTTHIFTPQSSQEATEDFADFQDCSFQSSTPPSTATDFSLIRSKIDTLVKTLFVNEDNATEQDEDIKHSSIDSEVSPSNDGTWAKVQDFEGSQGLMFKWLGSLTGTRLLKSLNINTNNIVYHEKWGTIEVPKFAASLVQSPLQPQSCNKYESQGKDDNPAIVNNNNTILSDDHNKPPPISAEAQEILRQLPDLSYMRANTLVFPPTSPSGL